MYLNPGRGEEDEDAIPQEMAAADRRNDADAAVDSISGRRKRAMVCCTACEVNSPELGSFLLVPTSGLTHMAINVRHYDNPTIPFLD